VHCRPRLTAVAVAVALPVLAVVAGCSHDVDAQVPPDAANPACVRLAGSLPATLLDEHRRDTHPSSPALAAWGDPAIVLRCGVTPPGPTTDQCTAVDGIDWVVRRLDDGYAFTTYGRVPAVQVRVPRHYAPETFALTGLATAVGTIAQGEHRCS
jgi:Protein of unknown function (DUF3515)